MPPPTCLIFDLDGTLVDSIPDLAACINRVLATRGLPPLSPAQVTGMVGDGAAVLLRRVFGFYKMLPDDDAMKDFLTDYTAHTADESVPYPGAIATLQQLHAAGFIMGVCTNKPEAPARQLLQQLGIAHLFAAISGGDSFAVRKPDPGHLLGAIAATGGTPRRAVMIGDHANDMQAAWSAGVPGIFVQWGYGGAEMAAGAIAEASRFEEIPGLVEILFSHGPNH